jgi:hypothetical protein
MAILAMLKLQDVEKFSSMFVGYDLLARRWVPYAYAYPFLEAGAGILMAAHALSWLSIPVALFIGTIGAISVFYAVYVQKRELKCACAGGSSNVPLGFVSLTENLMMIGMAVSQFQFDTPFTVRAAEWFVSFTMAILAMLKLQDVEKFSSMFVGYDLLARRWVPYSYAYPFLEAAAGVLMAAHALKRLSIPVALFIGSIGAVSVIYAVYVQKRELKCACVGGSSNVPLGFVSLTENLFMIGMALWMLLRP